MASSRLVKTKENANLWAEEHKVVLLDEIVDATTPIKFFILQGEYKGYIGAKVPSLMKPKSYGINWRCLTQESKAKYISDQFKSEGFTVLALPLKLGTDKKILVERDLDKVKWEITLTNFREGYRPPTSVKTSLGEQMIEIVLGYNSLSFNKEHPVKIENRNFRYDFYLPDYNLFIEYHGVQHYKESGMMSSGVSFEERIHIDKLKQNYAQKQGSYLAVPYTVDTIDTVTQELSKFLPVAIPTDDYVRGYKDSLITRDKQIADYYLTNTEKATCVKFNVAVQTVRRAFKRIYGCSRTEYKRGASMQEIANYYLTHTLTETKKMFNTSSQFIDRAFIQVYGSSKSKYKGV